MIAAEAWPNVPELLVTVLGLLEGKMPEVKSGTTLAPLQTVKESPVTVLCDQVGQTSNMAKHLSDKEFKTTGKHIKHEHPKAHT